MGLLLPSLQVGNSGYAYTIISLGFQCCFLALMQQKRHKAALCILLMSLTVLVFRPSFITFTLYLIEYWERARERAKGSMKNRGQEDIKWDMKDEEGWWGGGEKEWRRRTKSCTFQCRLSLADDTTWQTNEWAFNNLSTLLNALPLFLLPSLSLSFFLPPVL